VSKLWVLREEFGHTLLQLGDLGKLAELRFVLVKVTVERLGLVHKLGLLGQTVDDRLKEDTGICKN
jgi:hypothetical protein